MQKWNKNVLNNNNNKELFKCRHRSKNIDFILNFSRVFNQKRKERSLILISFLKMQNKTHSKMTVCHKQSITKAFYRKIRTNWILVFRRVNKLYRLQKMSPKESWR